MSAAVPWLGYPSSHLFTAIAHPCAANLVLPIMTGADYDHSIRRSDDGEGQLERLLKPIATSVAQ